MKCSPSLLRVLLGAALVLSILACGGGGAPPIDEGPKLEVVQASMSPGGKTFGIKLRATRGIKNVTTPSGQKVVINQGDRNWVRIPVEELQEGQDIVLKVDYFGQPDGELRVPYRATPTVQFESGGKVTCTRIPCAGKEANGELKMLAPPGTIIRWGGVEGVVEGKTPVSLRADLSEHVDKAEYTQIAADRPIKRYSIKVPLELELPDGTRFSTVRSLSGHALRPLVYGAFFQPTKGKPGLLPGESPTAKGTGATRVSLSNGARVLNVGNVRYARDYDYVGFGTIEKKGTKNCGVYKESGGKSTTLKMEGFAWEVTLYERRTGRKLGSKSFPAPALSSCPKTIPGAAAGGIWKKDPKDEVEAWVVATTR